MELVETGLGPVEFACDERGRRGQCRTAAQRLWIAPRSGLLDNLLTSDARVRPRPANLSIFYGAPPLVGPHAKHNVNAAVFLLAFPVLGVFLHGLHVAELVPKDPNG